MKLDENAPTKAQRSLREDETAVFFDKRNAFKKEQNPGFQKFRAPKGRIELLQSYVPSSWKSFSFLGMSNFLRRSSSSSSSQKKLRTAVSKIRNTMIKFFLTAFVDMFTLTGARLYTSHTDER